MAINCRAAHVSASAITSTPSRLHNPASLHPHTCHQSRRFLSFSLLLLPFLNSPHYAIAAGSLDKYVKRKKLEPLEDYIPAVILTQLQIEDLDKSLEEDQPQYANCRTFLRAGPASSFRANIRARIVALYSKYLLSNSRVGISTAATSLSSKTRVAQYASDGGMGEVAFNSVDQCLGALEELDSLLLRASRNDSKASVKLMKGRIGTVLAAVDSLLQTVPSDVLEKGKAIASAYRADSEDAEAQPLRLDDEVKQLESIL